jgi:flagellar biosynthetic protein FliP
MFTASLGILAALAFVLGLIALAVWALTRVGAGAFTGRQRLPVEVVQRLPLGPKAGLAVVRVGEKVLVVSMGEGGVHAVCDLDEADRQRVLAGLPAPHVSSPAAAAAFAPAARRPFADTLRSALGTTIPIGMPATAPQPTATTPRSSDMPASRRAEPRDLRDVLSMTLAPSTRLLGVVALLALGAFAPLPLQAQTSAAPAVAATVPPAPAPRIPPRPGTRGLDAVPPGSGTAPVEPASPAPVRASGGAATLIPQLDLRLGSGENGELRLNGTVGVVLMMGLLTLVPTLLLMMTGFTRILIVLHFLKQAMGTQSAPPAHLVAGLALLLTGFVMAPTIAEANRTALSPWLAGEIEQVEMLKTGVQPFRAFMLRQTNEQDLRTFVGMSRIEQPETPDDLPLHVLMSAFVASELRTAFQIGFAIYLPFIVIDAVVASVLMAMGMFMLPPAMISLPFKLLLFVLVDGWSLTIQSLVQSFR